jgi:hypothetical protein
LFPGDVDRVIEWQIWEGVVAENISLDYMILFNKQTVFEVKFDPDFKPEFLNLILNLDIYHDFEQIKNITLFSYKYEGKTIKLLTSHKHYIKNIK